MDENAQSRQAAALGWNFVDLLLILLVFLLSVVAMLSIGLMAVRFFPGLSGMEKTALFEHPFFLVPVQAAAYLLTFLFVRMHITVKTQRDFWEAVSWNFPSPGAALQCMMAGSALAVLVLISTTFLPMPPDLPVEKYFRIPGAIPLLAAFTVFVAPVMEELFFRGLLYPLMERTLGAVFGVILTALMFAAIHIKQLAGAWAPLLVLFTVGAALTYMRYRRRSLAASWLMHFSYNGTLMLVMFLSTSRLGPVKG